MERRPFFRVLGVASGAVLAETLGVELWDLARAMQASNVSDDKLDAMEASVLRLHQVHAKVSPATMLPHLHEHLRAVTSLLQQSQPIRQRRRLCSIAGHLVGLRAWATFDLADRQGARSWYELALQPATEAEDDALCGWIFGVALRIAAVSGVLMLALMWFAEVPFAQFTSAGAPTGSPNPFADSHYIYAIVLVVLAATYAGTTWGLGRNWARLPFVHRTAGPCNTQPRLHQQAATNKVTACSTFPLLSRSSSSPQSHARGSGVEHQYPHRSWCRGAIAALTSRPDLDRSP